MVCSLLNGVIFIIMIVYCIIAIIVNASIALRIVFGKGNNQSKEQKYKEILKIINEGKLEERA